MELDSLLTVLSKVAILASLSPFFDFFIIVLHVEIERFTEVILPEPDVDKFDCLKVGNLVRPRIEVVEMFEPTIVPLFVTVAREEPHVVAGSLMSLGDVFFIAEFLFEFICVQNLGLFAFRAGNVHLFKGECVSLAIKDFEVSVVKRVRGMYTSLRSSAYSRLLKPGTRLDRLCLQLVSAGGIMTFR